MNEQQSQEFINFFRDHQNLYNFVRVLPEEDKYPAYIAIKERERQRKNKYNSDRRKELTKCPNCKEMVKKGSLYYHKTSKICKLTTLLINEKEKKKSENP